MTNSYQNYEHLFLRQPRRLPRDELQPSIAMDPQAMKAKLDIQQLILDLYVN